MTVLRKRSRRDFAVAVAVAALGGAAWLLFGPSGGGGGTAHASHGKPLDHFLCYRGQFNPSTAVGANITLKDQFAPTAVAHKVGSPRWFCNPTNKRVPGGGFFPIIHPDNHLTAFGLTGNVPARKLRVNNQFQRAAPTSPPNLVTDPGTATQPKHPLILVPTRKLPHPAPANINHFKCYPTKPKAVNRGVGVQDQFAGASVQVLNAVLICNPAEKKRGTSTFPILHRSQHLVCYTITRAPVTAVVDLRNQFGPRRLSVTERFLLCAPSTKSIVP